MDMGDPAYDAMSKAKRQADSGNPEGAVETLEDFLSREPHNTKVRLYLAQLYDNNMGDRNMAMMQLDIVMDLEPENIQAMKALVLMLRVDKKQIVQANDTYMKLLTKLPDDVDLLSSYAIFTRKQLVDFPKAAELYEKALSLDPKRADIHYNYAILLTKDLKDYVKARWHLEESVRLDPTNYNAQKGLAILMKKRFKNDQPKKTFFRR